MITQEFKHGKNTIKIETVESVEDHKKNGLREGQYNKFSVNGKPFLTYMAMINYIIEENNKKGHSVVPDLPELHDSREKMLKNNQDNMLKAYENVTKTYKEMGVPEEAIKKIQDLSSKMNGIGIRVKE